MKVVQGSSNNEGFSKKMGWGEFKVVAINPDKDALIKLLGVAEDKQEDFKDPDYTGKTKEDEDYVSIVFWLEEVNTGWKVPYRTMIIDKQVESKSGKGQWVNQSGDSAYADSEENLPGFFTHFLNKDKSVKAEKTIRKAFTGEAQLVAFIKAWINNEVNYWDPETNILPDMKKLFRANVGELTKDYMKSIHAGTVLAFATIKSNEEGKEYQNLYRDVLPGYLAKQLRLSPTGKGNKQLERFFEQMTGEYGTKDRYSLEPLHDDDGSTEDAVTSTPNSTDSSY